MKAALSRFLFRRPSAQCGAWIASGRRLEENPSSGIQEQIARLKHVTSILPLDGKRVLDFGSGAGYSSAFIYDHAQTTEIIGLDAAEDCIQYARKHNARPDITYLVQDCLSYNPTLGFFDVAFCFEVLEHVTEQGALLDTLARYVAPSGVAVVSTPNRALFSLTKGQSFLNKSHVKELFFDEFVTLLKSSFGDVRIYSQVHHGEWHAAYVNYLSAKCLADAVQRECFPRGPFSRFARLFGRCFVFLLYCASRWGYRDVRQRRHSDFDFHLGCDPRAVWFLAVCSDPRISGQPTSCGVA